MFKLVTLKLKTKIKSKNYMTHKKISLMAAVFMVGIIAVTPIVYADQYDDQIKAIQNDTAQKKQNLNQLNSEAVSFADQINKLQTQINDFQGQINANQAKSDDLQTQIVVAEEELAKQKLMLGKNIKSMYLEGKISTLEILAASKDLSEFVDKQQYRNNVQDQIKKTLDKVNDLKLQLGTQKGQVEQLLKEQQIIRDQLAGQQAEQSRLLSLNKQQQDEYLVQIKTNNTQVKQLQSEQLAAYAAYARRNGVNQYGESGNGGYPSVWADAPQDSLVDNWGMYNRECVSYTAWKVSSTGRYMPYWGGRGNAYEWTGNAKASGIPVSNTPTVGTVAIWGLDDGLGPYGHAAYVELVHKDGSIEVSQYNFTRGKFSRMNVSPNIARNLDYINFQ